MSFAAFEQSDHAAQPIVLLEFRHGFSVWRYASSRLPDGTVPVYAGDSYSVIPMEIDALRQGGRKAAEQSITVPDDLPVVALFSGSPPQLRVTVTMRQIHVGDGDAEGPILWLGPVVTVSKRENRSAEIVSRFRGLQRGGARCTWGRGCQHIVYGPGCGAVKADHAYTRTVIAVDGSTITVNTASPEARFFDGGIVEWDADGLGTLEKRTIEREISDKVFKLFGRADWFTVGMTVTFYPGCDYTADTCDARFDALADYDGIDFMPGKSPFDGTALV